MGKNRKDHLKNYGRGHEWMKGRATEVQKDKRRKREKSKLQRELREWR